MVSQVTRPKTNGSELSQLASLVSGKYSNDIKVFGITHDSRSVQPGDLYVALRGENNHGIDFMDEAISNGAAAIASDSFGAEIAKQQALPVLELVNAREDMALIAAKIYGNPESKLVLTGVTGTNGKTTTTHILRSIFRDAGKHVGVIGTLGTYLDDEYLPGARTTPESTDLYAILALMVERGITHVFMEVSSHALALHRVTGIKFDVAVFTNLTQDHLDFHGSMENYFAAKALLFTSEFSRQAVICTDDDWGVKLATESQIPVVTIGRNGDWKTSPAISNSSGLTTQKIDVEKFDSISLVINMLGSFNATNAACALVVGQILGLPVDAILDSLRKVQPIPGRLEKVSIASAGTVFVDYAHTPDAVATVLTVIRDAKPEKIITVLGCGGDRDSTKRPLMGKVASELSDIVFVTDDNPRSEEPAEIRKAVLDGAGKGTAQVFEVADRRVAIFQALKLARDGDVIAILGKGHETGQEISGEVFPFDDRIVVRQESENV
ncbi:MAG: UDP-N-acetylmuramoyl-L-alanyl-D-glutamate--2,6-diaminopimelate ligase [Actinobacteria bacterium]|nr:UDP-N-acetylmuramoyl-L-alanyl-D-glutamate--2,6-diaminopimelate ligase [Actinomycetota bacterium]